MRCMEHDGRPFVSARDVESETGIAIKTLPGRDAVVACKKERCVMVPETRTMDGGLWVSAELLAEGFGASWDVDRENDVVRFRFGKSPGEMRPAEGEEVVGSLAPDMRFSLLHGGTLSLKDLRGKRVLINSWASW